MRTPTTPFLRTNSTTRAVEFREALAARPLAADGAMGTMLLARRTLVNRSLDELNLSLPALVRDVHQEFLRAGAEILGTNTFGANRQRLAAFGFGDRVRAVNQAGVRIAREAAREQAFVAGVVGPLGVRLEPFGSLSAEAARALFREQTDALVYAGVDLLVLETFQGLRELEQAVLAARESAGAEMVVVAELSVEHDGRLADGTPAAEFARRLDEWPVDAIGLNCGFGPAAMLAAIEAMGQTRKPLSAMPSAPAGVSAEYMGRYAARFLEAGVRIVGGCCGVTPEHVRAMAGEVRGWSEDRSLAVAARNGDERAGEKSEDNRGGEGLEGRREAVAVAVAERSELGAKLAARRFVTLVEMTTPRGADAAGEILLARRAKDLGADAVVVVDGPGARLSAAVTCQLIASQAGIETVLPVRTGGMRELLDAQAMGIRNLVCDSAGVTHLVKQLNGGLDWGGNPIGSQTSLLAGMRVNPTAADEVESAEFVITRPVYDSEALEAFLTRMEAVGLPVIVGVRPLADVHDAEFMTQERGVPVPAEIVARMEAGASGVEIAREMVERVRARVAGVYWSGIFTGELH